MENPKKTYTYLGDENKSSSTCFNTCEQQYTYINGLGFIPETPQQLERKQLVIQYNVLLLAILAFYLLRSVIFLPLIRILAIFKLGISVNPMTGMVNVTNSAMIPLVNLICYFIMMVIPTLIVFGFAKKCVPILPMFSAPRPRSMRYGLIILLGTSVIASGVSDSFFEVLKSGGLVIVGSKFQMQPTAASWVFYLITIVLLPAVLEEVLFRGVILRCLRRFGDLVAILVSTILFTLIQPNTSSMIYSFIMGLMLSYFALKSGSIILPMLGNFTIRAIGVLTWLAAANLPMDTAKNLHLLLSLVLLIGSMIAFFRFIKNDFTAFSINMEDTFLTNRTKLRYLFTNVGFWLLVILAFISMLPNMELIN